MAEALEENAKAPARGEFMGCRIDLLSFEQSLERAEAAMATRRRLVHVVVNVAKLMTMRRDPLLRADVESADMVNVDGMGVVWGARLCGVPVPERVTGIDLMQSLLAHCAASGQRPYILGAKPEVLARAVEVLRQRYPGLAFAGTRHGYYDADEEAAVAREIRGSGADCLFVAMTSPRKERFIARHGATLEVPFVMGVGGSIDVIAGVATRAPRWMQQAGLEWLHRILQEPRRLWKRYLVSNSLYLVLLAGEFFRLRLGRLL